MTYAYTALEPTGRKKSGFVDAETQDAAVAVISREGRFVVEIKEHKGRAASAQAAPGMKKRINRSDLALFTRRLADLSGAGLPLDRVLQIVSEQSESAILSGVAADALEDVRGGLPVSDALAKSPKLFPTVYTMTLKAGEASGQFPQVAARLADFQEAEVTRRSQITAALIYPIVLASVAIGVVLFTLLFVVPRLSGVFADLGSDLPTSTKILLATTGFISSHWVAILVGIALAFALYRAWVATEQGAVSRDRFYMRVPVFGPIVLKALVSRYARVLGTLIFGGVPILEALRLAGMAAGNRVFQKSGDLVEADVREGKPIAEALRDAQVFPPVLTNMVAVGEETGDLPKMLGRVSDSLDFEVDNALRRAMSLAEPAIIVFMGGVVMFVVLSIVLPIIQAQSTVH